MPLEEYNKLKSYKDSVERLNTLIKDEYVPKKVVSEKDEQIAELNKQNSTLNDDLASLNNIKEVNEKLKKNIAGKEEEIGSYKKQIKELKSSALKKQVNALNMRVDSLKDAIVVSDSVITVLMDSLVNVNNYLGRLEAFRLEFTKSELLARKTVLDKLFSKVELTELQALHEELKPFAVDSILPGEKRLVRNDEAKAFIDLYENVEYAIANKMRFLCCDSLLEAPFNAQTVSSLFAEIRIEKAYMSPGQSAEFEGKIKLLNRYATVAVELYEMMDGINNKDDVRFYRNDEKCDASIDVRKKRINDIFDSEKEKIDIREFDGLTYLSNLYLNYQKAFNENPLKLEGVNEIEKIEQEIKSIAEEAVKLQKK